MQQLIKQLTPYSMRSAGYPRGAANRCRRLNLSHIVCNAPIFDPAPEQLSGRGKSTVNLGVTTILSLFALVLMALALYQWALILQQQVDMERVRRESTVRDGKAVTEPAGPDMEVEIEVRRRISAYMSAVKPLVSMWQDVQSRADHGDTRSLAAVVSTLREVESRTGTVVPPRETKDVHERLLACMSRIVDEYETTIRSSVGDSVSPLSSEARQAIDAIAIELAQLESGAE